MLSFVLAFALQAAADPAAGRPVPNSFLYAGPVSSADYEADLLVTSATQPREQRIALLRTGSLVREETSDAQGRTITYADFESATSISYRRDENGRYRNLAILRPSSWDSWNRYRRERTGARDRALGEECEVSRRIHVGQDAGYDPETLSCETRDGIVLWIRSSSRTSGTVFSEIRTLSFRRRPVSQREVAPPATLLDWSRWRDVAPPVPLPAVVRPDYEIELVGATGGERARTMRRRGSWAYSESRRSDRRTYYLDNRAVGIAYEAEPDGSPVRLQIDILPPEQVRANDAAGFTPVDGLPPEQVLGETCRWSDRTGWIVITSGMHRTCATADGLSLRIFDHHRVLYADLTAVEIRRASPPLDALMPPREAFDWARWGIRPAR